jgi:hypothetical protein
MNAYIKPEYAEVSVKQHITPKMEAEALLPFGRGGTGYGSKIPTSYMIQDGKRWKRVYCMIYSNSGSLYILRGKEKVFVDIDR